MVAMAGDTMRESTRSHRHRALLSLEFAGEDERDAVARCGRHHARWALAHVEPDPHADRDGATDEHDGSDIRFVLGAGHAVLVTRGLCGVVARQRMEPERGAGRDQHGPATGHEVRQLRTPGHAWRWR